MILQKVVGIRKKYVDATSVVRLQGKDRKWKDREGKDSEWKDIERKIERENREGKDRERNEGWFTRKGRCKKKRMLWVWYDMKK